MRKAVDLLEVEQEQIVLALGKQLLCDGGIALGRNGVLLEKVDRVVGVVLWKLRGIEFFFLVFIRVDVDEALDKFGLNLLLGGN